jgi:hypothetical protein
MRHLLFAFILFTILLLPTYSQDPENPDSSSSEQNENIITAVSIVGLKRTKPHGIDISLQKFIGCDAGDIEINDIYAIIKDTNTLEPLSVEITDNETGYGKTLAVTVREKWSIFPVPFFSINSDSWSVGGAFMDANAFGLRDMMLIAGSYGSDRWLATLMYIKTPKAAEEFGFSARGMFLHQDTENTDQTGNDVLRRYSKIAISPEFSLSYTLTQAITSSFGVSYFYTNLIDTENQLNAPEDGIQAVTLSPRINIRTSSWDGYLLSEKSASFGYNYRFIIGDADAQSISLNAVFNHSIIPGLKVTAKTRALMSTNSASPFFESTPSSTVNILSHNYSTLNYVAASVGLEKYLFKFSQGTVSAAVVYQTLYSDGVFLHHQFDHGPVATVQMYLSKFAFPGVGLGAAYNVDKNNFRYTVNLGMSF